MHRLHLWLTILVTLAAATPAFSSNPAATLAGQMAERLAVMEQVAAYKHQRGLPVADPQREQALLAELETKGHALGLSAGFTRTFFRAQIEAAKQVQTERLAAWNDGAPVPTAVPDLINDIRPALDRLSALMLAGLREIDSGAERTRTAECAARHLRACGYSPAVIEAATAGWSTTAPPSE